MTRPHGRAAAAAILAWVAASAALAAAPLPRMDSRAAPPESERARIHAPAAQWLAGLREARRLELGAPSRVEREMRMPSESKRRRAVGFGRTPDISSSRIFAAQGESTLKFSVRSPTALQLRVAVSFADEAQYRITSYAPGDESRAVSLYRKASSTAEAMATVWAPISDGEAQVVVVERFGAPAGEWSVTVPRVSHFVTPLAADVAPAYFGDSAPCQVDIACVYQVAPVAMQAGIVRANFSVALMTFTQSDGLSYWCTGTLLNSANYPTPIFLTAHHCLSDPASLASLTTMWFFNRTSCHSGTVSSAATQVAGGATSLFGSVLLDAALIVLNQMPPSLATYSGWDATTMQPNTDILAIHHPRGDVKKASFGTEVGIETDPLQFDIGVFPANTFYVVQWDLGIVEPGSSGSGLFSFDAGTGFFYLRGTLTGGSDFTCNDFGKATTYYARFDNLYPSVQASLSAAPPPATTTLAVEYYYADWNFYFETSFADEIAALDGGAFGGAWKRTGETFKVWPQPTGSASATCRFFSVAFAPKSSHFYTPFADECAIVETEPEWQYEAIAFYVQLADASGICPAGTIALYRAYNNGMGDAPNHRYTTSLAILDQMLAAGWQFEGNGDTKVFACVPQ